MSASASWFSNIIFLSKNSKRTLPVDQTDEATTSTINYFSGQFEYEVSPISSPQYSPTSSNRALATPVTITQRMVPVTKTVYLIRHAESDENRRLASLGRSVKGLGSLSLPNKSDVIASMELINIKAQIDSDVSPRGQIQINEVGKAIAKDDFVRKMGIQLVAHSPLKRARQTSEGMLGCVTEALTKGIIKEEDSSAEGCKADSVGRVVELPVLAERTPMEWLPINHYSFTKRIAQFEQWLSEQPEDVIAIVGHSQYFKSMLALPKKFKNCDLWSLQFDHSVKLTHKSVKADVNTAESAEKQKKLKEKLSKAFFKDEKKDESEDTQGEENDKRDSSEVYEDDNEIYEIDGVRVDNVELPRGWRELKRHYTFDADLANDSS